MVATWASRLATLSNWLAQIAPLGSLARQPLGDAARDLHVIVGVAVRHRRDLDQVGAERAQRVLLLLALGLGDDDDGVRPSALPTSARPMPVLPAVPSTTTPPGLKLAAASASG